MSNISKQQVLDAFHFRSACRYYDPNKKISREDMDYILELGRLSPSSVGSEPWKFIVLQNPQIREKIKPFCWGIKHPMEEMSHLVVILAKKECTLRFRIFPYISGKTRANPGRISNNNRTL